MRKQYHRSLKAFLLCACLSLCVQGQHFEVFESFDEFGNLKFGYIDAENSDNYIAPIYEMAYSFSDGFAWVMLNGKWVIINSNGEHTAENLEYDDTWPFLHGIAKVEMGSDYGFIDTLGNEIVAPGVSLIEVHNGFTYYGKDGLLGLEKSNTLITKPIYESIGLFHANRAVVQLEGKYGYIDTTGVAVIDLDYDWASDFENDVATVRVASDTFLIDTNGKILK